MLIKFLFICAVEDWIKIVKTFKKTSEGLSSLINFQHLSTGNLILTLQTLLNIETNFKFVKCSSIGIISFILFFFYREMTHVRYISVCHNLFFAP